MQQHVFLTRQSRFSRRSSSEGVPRVLADEQQPAIERGQRPARTGRVARESRQSLPARVMVNRIWQGHFGKGIVRTANNFGIVGERPTHPELLDWLAAEFISNGWSVKKMHRLIMLSSAYQMSSEITRREEREGCRQPAAVALRDAPHDSGRDSRFPAVARWQPRLTMGGTLQTGEGTDNEFSDGRKSLHPDNTKRRTVYLAAAPFEPCHPADAFRFRRCDHEHGDRAQTNVAPQALFMMNSKFVAERARSLAKLLLQSDTVDDAA